MTTAVSPRQLWFLDTLVEIKSSVDESEDGLSVIENRARRGDSPPAHIHHTEDEVFHVIEGELRIVLGGEEITVGPGETLLAPKGIPHTYVVTSEGARWLAITANGDFERFVRSFSRAAERAKLPPPSGPPTPERAAALEAACREHGIELIGPPLVP